MTRRSSSALPVDGVFLLDKPVGISSNAAIQRVKRLFSAAKAGHVGTLDPLASGLLPVCLGEATKFSAGTFAADKVYEATVLLGVTTTTGDTEGSIVSRKAVAVERERLLAVLQRFTGRLEQMPPMYSALKHAGKPLYEYARAGETVARAPRQITIHDIRLMDVAGDQVRIRVSCSKGTYIRVLAEDIGLALGCGATLAALRRSGVGRFGADQAITLEKLEATPVAQRTQYLMPVDCLVSALPALELPAEAITRIVQGQVVPSAAAGVGSVRLYDHNGRFLGLGELQPGGQLAPKRLLAVSASATACAEQSPSPKIA